MSSLLGLRQRLLARSTWKSGKELGPGIRYKSIRNHISVIVFGQEAVQNAAPMSGRKVTWESVRARIEADFSDDGIRLSYLRMTLSDDVSQNVRGAAGIASLVEWKLSAFAQYELIAEARTQSKPYDTVTAEVLQSAALLAISRNAVPQYWRDGEKWVRDERGRRAKVVPCTLPLLAYWRWLYKEVCKAAEALILDRRYPAMTRDVLDAIRTTVDKHDRQRFNDEGYTGTKTVTKSRVATPFPSEDHDRGGDNDPLQLLVVDEEYDEVQQEVRALLEDGPARQRDFLLTLLDELEKGDEKDAEERTASRLGMNRNAVRQMKHRIRHRKSA